MARKADVELLEWNRAPACRTRDVDIGVEREQSWRKIARESCKAHAAALRCDVADGAGCLQAMVIGAPPPFALIVEDAARVEAEIAADGAHVAVRGAGDVRGGLRDDGVVLVDRGVLGDFA